MVGSSSLQSPLNTSTPSPSRSPACAPSSICPSQLLSSPSKLASDAEVLMRALVSSQSTPPYWSILHRRHLDHSHCFHCNPNRRRHTKFQCRLDRWLGPCHRSHRHRVRKSLVHHHRHRNHSPRHSFGLRHRTKFSVALVLMVGSVSSQSGPPRAMGASPSPSWSSSLTPSQLES